MLSYLYACFIHKIKNYQLYKGPFYTDLMNMNELYFSALNVNVNVNKFNFQVNVPNTDHIRYL